MARLTHDDKRRYAAAARFYNAGAAALLKEAAASGDICRLPPAIPETMERLRAAVRKDLRVKDHVEHALMWLAQASRDITLAWEALEDGCKRAGVR